MKKLIFLLCMAIFIQNNGMAQTTAPRVKTANGTLQGLTEASGIRSFKGIPFAQPPVGDLRWKEPQPAANWQGVRMADKFGPQAMQQPLYSDMIFRSAGKSEDCLYLNVWAPKAGSKKLPVLVYFYGGGFITGDGSEGRYDGESMAKKGIVAVTVNYRLGVFGFMAHPELTKESPHHASGNYGLMDQHAALVWVKNNIAAFGGDPAQVTIAGESAGSMSVSAQIASPLSAGLFRGAIAESGALLGNLSPTTLAAAEQSGVTFATRVKATSLADLRKIPADSLLKWGARGGRFGCTVDGYFLPEQPQAIFAAGKQMKVALLAGWNSAEGDFKSILGRNVSATPENYKAAIQKAYGDKAADILTHYPGNNEDEIRASGNALASDKFIAFSTWKMIDLQARTQSQPVYRYWYVQPRPMLATDKEKPAGAVHSAEIEYAMGNLHYNKVYNWTPDDLKTSEIMYNYFANFIKTLNPNGAGLPVWNTMQSIATDKIMVIDANAHAIPDNTKARYAYMDGILGK